MAGELRISIHLSFSKGGATLSKSFSDSVTVTGNAVMQAVQEIGTSEEALTVHADIGTVGYVYIKNLDATNYVEIGRTTGVYTMSLLAGEGTIFRLTSGTAIYAKANTAACNVEYILVEL